MINIINFYEFSQNESIKTYESFVLPVLGTIFLILFLFNLFIDMVKNVYPNNVIRILKSIAYRIKEGKIKPNLNKYDDYYTIELEVHQLNIFVRFDEDYNNISLSTLNRKNQSRYKLNIDLIKKIAISRSSGVNKRVVDVSDKKINKIIDILNKIKNEI